MRAFMCVYTLAYIIVVDLNVAKKIKLNDLFNDDTSTVLMAVINYFVSVFNRSCFSIDAS